MEPLLFLDTETTAIEDGRLVELAYALQFPGLAPSEVKSFRVKPERPISVDAMATHHITNLDVINQPAFSEHPSYPVIADMAEHYILIAHNAPFDLGVLQREGIATGRWIDTRRVALHLVPDAPKHSLQFLRYYLGCQTPGLAHTAEGDVRVLIAVFEKLMARLDLQEELGSMQEKIERLIQLSTAPVLLKLVPSRLKKHAGKTFSEVNRIDVPYILWGADQDWSDLEIGDDLRYTFRHWRGIKSLQATR